jgi:hypothetical protein
VVHVLKVEEQVRVGPQGERRVEKGGVASLPDVERLRLLVHERDERGLPRALEL